MPRKLGAVSLPTPESVSLPETHSVEQEEESNAVEAAPGIIIIHPGSHSLRLGLSTQLDPHSIPHIIAYRSYSATPSSSSSLLAYPSQITASDVSKREEELDSIIDDVTEARAKNEIYDADSDITQYGALNAESPVVPCGIDDEVTFQWSDVGTGPQFVIGNEALYLHPSSPYKVYKPLRYGSLNTSVSISRSVVLKQLEDLWCRAVEECLDIPKKEFKFYRVIVCAPDVIDRMLYKDFMDIVLNRLNFEAALVHQESVCATYGAGVSAACVVDVGEERTTLCCVEDGLSNANTRLTLKYGGNDITRFFYWLLQRAYFPYESCSVDSVMDGHLVTKLKEKYCHFDMTVWGVAEEEVIVPHVGESGVKFSIHFADELVYSPMGVYYPVVFSLSEKEVMAGQENQPVLPEDIYDEANWGSEQNTLLKASSNSAATKNGPDHLQTSSSTTAMFEVTRRLQSMETNKVMALDEAVHFSIDCASSVEMKRKLYGSVLLIGGGLGFLQTANILKTRLEQSLPHTFRSSSDTVEVCSNPRDLNPSNVSWRGGAVLAALDCCQELWIEKQDWELFGVRLLRERSLFVW